MASRKVNPEDKQRDALRTREGLMGAVANMLALRQYSMLKSSKIGSWIDMGRSAVYDAYGSLTNLLKAYVAKVDHWPAIFERHRIAPSANDDQIKQGFINILQDNLTHFSGSKAMQDLILWQFSDRDNRLLYGISEEREAVAAELFRMTDRHFKDTDVDFRAVVAFMLLGSYAFVLHANNNGSTVCGLNIKNDRDWRRAQRTMVQIIDRMWDMGSKENLNNRTNMNFELVYLEDLAIVISKARTAADFDADPDERLVTEAKRVARVMRSHLLNTTNDNQVSMYLQINLHTLVAVCDMLYDHSKKHNPDAQVVLGLLEEIRLDLSKHIPGNLRIPRMFRELKLVDFQKQFSGIKKRMKQIGISVRLAELVGIPFEKFGKMENKLEWEDFKYLRKYANQLERVLASPQCSESMLIDALIGLGYNGTDFMLYYFEVMRESALASESEGEAKMVLRRYRMMIRQVVRTTRMRYDPYKQPVVKGLTKWIDAELEF